MISKYIFIQNIVMVSWVSAFPLLQVTSIHMAQTRWMLNLLLLMVPDDIEDPNQEQEHQYMTDISPQRLDEDAKMLAEKLDYFCKYVTRYT